MKEGPDIAAVAALIGDPARANMLTALMDGRALTAGELAAVAGVALPTASEHLRKLGTAGLLTVTQQGRHRYHRLSGADVAGVLEALMGLAQRSGAMRTRTGPRDAAMREARVCYDHLAGERGVQVMDRLVATGVLSGGADPVLRAGDAAIFQRLGIDVALLGRARRPLCRACLDWSERRPHLGGGLGAAVLAAVLDRGWARREAGRVIRFSVAGGNALDAALAA